MTKLLVLVVLCFLPECYLWIYNEFGMPDCEPQTTPLNGEKWCNFTKMASERGTKCTFKCSKGFALLGPEENECVDAEYGTAAHFKPEHGTCEPVSPLSPGSNGPFYVYARFGNFIQEMGLNANEEVVPKNITANESVSFNIEIPGLFGISGTVSLALSSQPLKYLVVRNHSQLVIQSYSGGEEELITWKNSASFKITQNKFFQGYSTFSPILLPNSLIMTDNHHIIVGNGSNLGVEDKKRSSFFLSKTILESNYIDSSSDNDDGFDYSDWF